MGLFKNKQQKEDEKKRKDYLYEKAQTNAAFSDDEINDWNILIGIDLNEFRSLLENTNMYEEKYIEQKQQKKNAKNNAKIIKEKKFTPNKFVHGLSLDKENKTFQMTNILSKHTYSYDDLVSFELVENDNSITKGGVSFGRAIIGTALFGGPGAIIGGLSGQKNNINYANSLEIHVSLKSDKKPFQKILLLTSKTDKSTRKYKKAIETANEVLGVLNMIVNDSLDLPSMDFSSNADEIRKFKGLLDDGIITQEEFDLKKKNLLDL